MLILWQMMKPFQRGKSRFVAFDRRRKQPVEAE